MKDTFYVLVPLEITATDGGAHPYHHRAQRTHEIERMMRAGFSYKSEDEALQYLNNRDPHAPLKIRFPKAKLFSNNYPNATCQSCGETIGIGKIRWVPGISWHEECWNTK